MPISNQRIVPTTDVRNFGRITGEFELSDLTRIQTESYSRFLQADLKPESRKNQGLEEILREIFPIENYDGQYRLEYVKYELGKPRYSPRECRQLRMTYGRPFRVWLRLVKEEPIEEEVYLGDMRSCSAVVSSSSTGQSVSSSASCTALPVWTSCTPRRPEKPARRSPVV